MLTGFFPSALGESALSLDYPGLYEKGFRGLIFDIDGTLVPHGADSTPEVDAFFGKIQSLGFRTLLLSNNDQERVLRFLKNIDTLYICDADKPEPFAYEKAVQMLGLRKEQVLVIGDQVFTDILGANRAGLSSVLVHYILWPGETRLGLRRRVEAALVWVYKTFQKSSLQSEKAKER